MTPRYNGTICSSDRKECGEAKVGTDTRTDNV